LLAVIAAYAFHHERLFAQQLWTPEGGERFLIYSAIYWTIAALFLFLAPRWLGPAAAGFAVGYAIWWSGLAAPFAVLYLLGSCFFLGKILWREADDATAILLGLAAWMLAVWIALHFSINTRPVYLVAFGLPYLRARPTRVTSFRATFGFALLLYFLLAYFFVSLMPEVSADGLSMHLALPMAVAHDHRWAFDFRHYTWSLMPAGGDAVFTAAYVLGGEAAATLMNFGLLVLIAAMIFQASQRWLAAALFASTPLALLVTGSLFVENVWAAMVLGAVLALVRYSESGKTAELRAAGVFFGAALAVKLIAAIFIAPAVCMAAFVAWKHGRLRQLLPAAALLAFFAAPPYVYSWAKSGNPVFPFANAIFRSPYFGTTESFSDPRFTAPISWRTPYDVTFRSGKYFEGQPGGAGFQYFLLLLPAAIFVRRRAALLSLAMGAGAAILLLVFLPNLRYLYPALPMLSIAIGGLLDRWRGAATVAFTLVAALNAWFLGASGWYHKDFAVFRKTQIASYVASAVPERALIDRLNREAPSQPAAFFSSGAVAGLNGLAFTDSWHTNDYWERLRAAQTSAGVADILRRLGIRHIVAPVSLQAAYPLFETFLREWARPDGPPVGRMSLFDLREAPVETQRSLTALAPGGYDDLDSRIEYNGAWIHDPQFAEAANGSITYCNIPAAWFRLAFEGSGITYIFTKAANRGIAQISIDGIVQGRIDMYSAVTQWRSQKSFTGLAPGMHLFEVRVLGEKNPAASQSFVDIDSISVP
jgi:hypothetical protein